MKRNKLRASLKAKPSEKRSRYPSIAARVQPYKKTCALGAGLFLLNLLRYPKQAQLLPSLRAPALVGETRHGLICPYQGLKRKP